MTPIGNYVSQNTLVHKKILERPFLNFRITAIERYIPTFFIPYHPKGLSIFSRN